MRLQNNVIACYKELFPKDTLKDISTKTGIQVTRIFRILNGHDMKLPEYECFQKACFRNVSDNLFAKLFTYATKCTENLTARQIKDLVFHMEDLIEIHNIKNDSVLDFINQQIC